MTSPAGSQAVDPFGRCASRTSTQPGVVAMTGSTEGRSYQLAGTVSAATEPEASRPGLAYLGAVRSTVASMVLLGTVLASAVLAGAVLAGAVLAGAVLAGAVPARTAFCRSRAACLAFGVGREPATAAVAPPPGGPPDESSSPADTATAAAATTLTVIAARSIGAPHAETDPPLRLRSTTHSDDAVS